LENRIGTSAKDLISLMLEAAMAVDRDPSRMGPWMAGVELLRRAEASRTDHEVERLMGEACECFREVIEPRPGGHLHPQNPSTGCTEHCVHR
jgi:hypothetical protein